MILAIIQARYNSTRLPGKVLMDLGGKPLLRHVIDAVSQCKSVQKIVVATGGGNGAIAAASDTWGVPCWQDWDHPEADALGRFLRVAKHYHWATHVLRVCGDSPLFDHQAADALCAAAVESGADYTGYQIDGQPAVLRPTGYFGEVVKVDALERADRLLKCDDPRREHVTACMYEEGLVSPDGRRDLFSCHWMKVPKWYAKEPLKLAAVDTAEDLERVREAMR